VLLSLLDALAHAHARGTIHLDVKPANALLAIDDTGAEVVKLTDFGLVGALAVVRSERIVMGTPSYMAPEQFAGVRTEFGPWTDLYALGCLAFELLSGRVPFPGDDLHVLGLAHRDQARPELTARVPVPVGVEAWVHRMIAPHPARRFRRAADAAFALSDLPDRAGGGAGAAVERTLCQGPTLVLPDWSGIALGEPPDGLVSRPPPVPDSWRGPEAPPPRPAGLELVAVRHPRLVGRQVAQDALWQELVAAASGDGRLVLLHGPSGSGTTRLAHWIGQRAHEVGAATVLTAQHAPVATDEHGLRGLVRRFLHAASGTMAEVEARARWLVGPDLSHELAVLAVGTPRPSALREGVVRLVQALCDERPVVLVLDDVAYGEDALAVAGALASRSLPCLTVLTVHDELLPGRPRESAVLAQVRPRATEIAVGPLDDGAALTFVEGLLDLEPKLASELATRTAGNPQLATQTLLDLVQRDLIVPSPSGFRLRVGASIDVPANLAAAWSKRVLAALTGARGVAAGVAAALGMQVDEGEWRAVCEALALVNPEVETARLRGARLMLRTDRGWVFTHAMARDAVLDTLDDPTRAAVHAACADHLSGDAIREGPHRYWAGELQASLEPLYEGLNRGLYERGDLGIADELLDLLARAIRALGLPESDSQHGSLAMARMQVAIERGEIARGELLCRELIARAEANGWPQFVAPGLLTLGEVLRSGDRLDEAMEVYERARILWDAAGSRPGGARARLGIAGVLRASGRHAAAEVAYRDVLDHAPDAHPTRVQGLLGLYAVMRSAGRYEGVEAVLDEAEQVVAQLDMPLHLFPCRLARGEAARHAGDLDAAERWYRAALDGLPRGYRRRADAAEINLALLYLMRADYEGAETLLRKLERWGSARTQREARVLALVLLADGPPEAWRRGLDAVGDVLESRRLLDPDHALALELAARRADGGGLVDRAREAWQLASAQWQELGRPADVARIAAHLDGP
jgi:tetratricopeptide (TPR) repeat protein